MSIAAVTDRSLGVVRWTHVGLPLLVFSVIALMGQGQFGYLVANPNFMRDLMLTHYDIGVISTAFLMCYGIGILFWGIFFIDRVGPKRTMLFGLVGWSIFQMVGGLAHGYEGILISRCGFGFMVALLWPAPSKLTAAWFPHSERARGNAIWILGLGVGMALLSLTIPQLFSAFGWRSSFFCLAVISLLIGFPVIAIFVQDHPGTHERVSTEELSFIGGHSEARSTLLNLAQDRHATFRRPAFWMSIFLFAVVSSEVWGIFVWAPAYLRSQLPEVWVGVSLMAGYLLSVPVGLYVAHISDKLQRRGIFVAISNLILGLLFLGYRVTPVGSVTNIILVVLSIVVVLGGVTLFTVAALHNIVDQKVIGFAASVMTGVGNIVAAYVPLGMAYIIGTKVSNYGDAFLLVSIVAFLGSFGALFLIRAKI
ncbi:MFS transporter [Acidocella facilis]|uniref:MFS transporter n=1 Tax=Acidocella facilis TaxID=525 RepID=UPI001F1D4AE2|nr:MFS transporter [Acidocella facilis]